MFGRLSRLFRGRSAASKGAPDSPFAAPPAQPSSPASRTVYPASPAPQGPPPSPLGGSPPDPFAESEATTFSSGESIKIPWSAVLKQIPADFLRQTASESSVRGSFLLVKDVAVRQLAHGAVKVPLSEIRRAAPPGVFVESDKGDNQLISLPMRDILRRIRPETYERRPDQRRIEVPESVGDLFGPRGQTLSAVRILRKEDLRKSQAAPGAPAPPSTSFLRRATVPQRESPTAHAVPETPPAVAPARREVQPGGTIAVPEALRMAMQSHPPATPKTAGSTPLANRVQPPAPAAPKKAPAPTLPRLSRPVEKKLPRPPEPAPAPAEQPGAASQSQGIVVPVAEISAQWPESIRQEITQLGLEGAQCCLPVVEMMAAAKHGRIAFPWGKIRAWIEPGPSVNLVSGQEETTLEIPLQAVVPSFLQTRLAPEPHPGKAAPAPGRETPPVRAAATASLRVPPPPSGATELHVRTPTGGRAAGSGSPETRRFSMPLADVMAQWPSQVVEEIQRLNLQDATLEIPVDVLEADLKAGRIEHCWIQICSWISGFPDTADTSQHAGMRLELPLPVVAPRFFAARSTGRGKKSYVPTDIPDLFNSGAPPPPAPVEAEPVPAPEAEVAPAPAAAEAPEAAAPAKKKLPGNIAELFGEPKKRNWTPNEIVHKTAAIEGVAGALIALQDGLLVASCMPPEWKSETVAAFLPQMFGRMKQYARELSTGELKSIGITVEQGHLQVFNAGLIYFSVLGFPDIPLPLPELNIIATELSRHTK